MSIRGKTLLKAGLGLVLVYAVTPFFAGALRTYDCRGPKIFFEAHHEILYDIGSAMVGRGRSKEPYGRERPWFYGVEGKRTRDPGQRLREEVEAYDRERKP